MNSLLSFLNALLIVGVAELGDKTQLLVVGLSSKYKLRDVLAGIFFAISLNSLLAVMLGSFVGVAFVTHMTYVKIAAGLLFLFFGISSLRDTEGEQAGKTGAGRFPILSVSTAFFVAELGDKTQIATASIAATDTSGAVPIFCGAASGLILANLIAIVVGIFLCKSVPDRFFRYISAAIFWAFGLFTLLPPFIEMLGTGWGVAATTGAAALSALAGALILKKCPNQGQKLQYKK